MSRKPDKGRLPPFVPLLIDTLNSAAWRALSHGAKVLYIALRRRYGINQHNNGRIYLSLRQAQKEMRSNLKQIARWFRELQHYGFIVQTMPGCLGLDGKGKAPHWRLTELGYMREPPTREFLKWDGKRFSDALTRREKNSESRGRIHPHPVGEFTHTTGVNSPTPNGQTVGENTHIRGDKGVGEITHISRSPLSGANSGRPPASRPHPRPRRFSTIAGSS
jgi:hypothetical protein